MKNMKKVAKTLGTLGLVGCAAMNSPFAVADDTFWFIGGNIGQSGAKIDDARIISQLPGSVISDDDSATAYKLFGGYQFNKNFALEGGYFNLGKFGYTATTLTGAQRGSVKLQGMNLDAVGIMPINDNFSAFGRLGLQYAQAKDEFSSSGTVTPPANPNPSANITSYKAGLGVQYDFNDTLGMRLEAERHRIDDAVGNRGDINMYSVGLIYRFNEKKPAPVQKAAAPAPVAAVAPVFIYVPVKEKTEQYCSVLDLNFEINADQMQRDDKEKLATLGTFLNKYPGTIAVIEGHTDNVGSAEKNMELSQRRADSVVKYLADELHIAPARLVSKGYGETRPIADNSTKEGQQMNRRIGAVIGCAPGLEGLTVASTRMTVAMEIEFDPYKSEVDPKFREGLRAVANFMKANPSVTATVEGHADKYLGEGSDKIKVDPEVAMKVSQRRAQNVVNYLADNFGVSRSRLSAEGYGNTRRVAYGTTMEGQQENRRVNIIFNYKAR